MDRIVCETDVNSVCSTRQEEGQARFHRLQTSSTRSEGICLQLLHKEMPPFVSKTFSGGNLRLMTTFELIPAKYMQAPQFETVACVYSRVCVVMRNRAGSSSGLNLCVSGDGGRGGREREGRARGRWEGDSQGRRRRAKEGLGSSPAWRPPVSPGQAATPQSPAPAPAPHSPRAAAVRPPPPGLRSHLRREQPLGPGLTGARGLLSRITRPQR